MAGATKHISCRWKGCQRSPADGALLCNVHVAPPEPSHFPAWVRDLPITLGTGLAGSLLYDLLKHFASTAYFSDPTAEKVDGMLARLSVESLIEIAADEFALFIQHSQDPYFARDMTKILAASEKYADVDVGGKDA